METLHQTSFHMGWIVGLEVQVPVCVCECGLLIFSREVKMGVNQKSSSRMETFLWLEIQTETIDILDKDL